MAKDSIINILGLKTASLKNEIEIRKSMLDEYEEAVEGYEYMFLREQVAHRRTKIKWNIYFGISLIGFGYLLTK